MNIKTIFTKRKEETQFEDFDIYVLIEDTTIFSIKQFVEKWAAGLDEITEFVIGQEDGSYLEFDDIEELLDYALQTGNYASLYWFESKSETKIDSLFLFFNEDGSIIVGVGKRLRYTSEALPYLEELDQDLNVIAGYVTEGVPANSREDFLDVARRSEAPKILDGIVIKS